MSTPAPPRFPAALVLVGASALVAALFTATFAPRDAIIVALAGCAVGSAGVMRMVPRTTRRKAGRPAS